MRSGQSHPPLWPKKTDMETAYNSELETSATAVADPADRRRSPRQSFVSNAWLSSEAGTRGSNHHIVVVDLSLHGIGFSSDERLDPEAVHWMVLDTGGLRQRPRANCLLPSQLQRQRRLRVRRGILLNRRSRFPNHLRIQPLIIPRELFGVEVLHHPISPTPALDR